LLVYATKLFLVELTRWTIFAEPFVPGKEDEWDVVVIGNNIVPLLEFLLVDWRRD
jgi:hypothetical protein